MAGDNVFLQQASGPELLELGIRDLIGCTIAVCHGTTKRCLLAVLVDSRVLTVASVYYKPVKLFLRNLVDSSGRA
jgi:hypothetical protein